MKKPETMKLKKKLHACTGILHIWVFETLLYLAWKRIKRGDNRDKRVELLQLFARTHFPSVKYMEYAVQVETYTLSKANNLVLNVDGAIGSLFLDLLAGSGMFTKQEIDEIVEIGYLNGLFVLARSIGLIG
jgi:ATP citrate (pro-S)-lyase